MTIIPKLLNQRPALFTVRGRRGSTTSQAATTARIPTKKPIRSRDSCIPVLPRASADRRRRRGRGVRFSFPAPRQNNRKQHAAVIP